MGQCKFSIDDNYSSLIFERLFNRNINFSHVLGYVILDSRKIVNAVIKIKRASIFVTAISHIIYFFRGFVCIIFKLGALQD